MKSTELVSISEDSRKARSNSIDARAGWHGMARKIALAGQSCFLQCARDMVFVFRHGSRNDFLNIAYVQFGVT